MIRWEHRPESEGLTNRRTTRHRRRAVYEELNLSLTYDTNGQVEVGAGPSACSQGSWRRSHVNHEPTCCADKRVPPGRVIHVAISDRPCPTRSTVPFQPKRDIPIRVYRWSEIRGFTWG